MSPLLPAPFPLLQRISVGSTSPPTLAAVRSALKRFGVRAPVTGFDVETGVPLQPVDLAEISQGARNRARAAFALGTRGTDGALGTLGTDGAQNGESARELAVGIEDGLALFRELDPQPLNVGCAVVTDGLRESAALSSAFAYPSTCLTPALSARAPIGDVFDAFWRERVADRDGEPSGRGEGNVGKLTLGVLTREEYARHAVVCALIRFLHPDLYFTGPQAYGPAQARKQHGRQLDE